MSKILVVDDLASDRVLAGGLLAQDEGPGFNPDNLPAATSPDYLERPSGRGLLLMRSFLDQITFNDVGNEITLVKRRTSPS